MPSHRDPIHAKVRKSWRSRIALLEALEQDKIVLWIQRDGERELARAPSSLPLGVRVLITDPVTTREVLVIKNATKARDRQGKWHVVP